MCVVLYLLYSALLAKLLSKKASGKGVVLGEEYELVHQTIFTDPDDRSGWFYHLWLLDQTVKTHLHHLVSSWPPRSLNVALSRTGCLDDHTLSHLVVSFRIQENYSSFFTLINLFKESTHLQ